MKYRKKPVVIEASQWFRHGDHPAVRKTDYSEVSKVLGTSGCSRTEPYWCWDAMGMIDTPEGRHAVIPGDWIITGVEGERYPCKPHIFEKTYEPATQQAIPDVTALVDLLAECRESINDVVETPSGPELEPEHSVHARGLVEKIDAALATYCNQGGV